MVNGGTALVGACRAASKECSGGEREVRRTILLLFGGGREVGRIVRRGVWEKRRVNAARTSAGRDNERGSHCAMAWRGSRAARRAAGCREYLMIRAEGTAAEAGRGCERRGRGEETSYARARGGGDEGAEGEEGEEGEEDKVVSLG